MGKTYDLYFIKDQSETKNNVYVIVDKKTKRTAIVDPTCKLSQIEELVSEFELIVDAVLVTHTHSDHTRCIDDLVSLYDCKVYVSRIESYFYSYKCQNIQLFEDDEIIELGFTNIRCLVTPGHTLGSSCFLLEGSLFAGDTIFMEGCGLCTSKGSSPSSMFHSINRIKTQLDNSVLVYSGHTYLIQPGQSIAYLKENNIYFIIDNEDEFVKFRTMKNKGNLYAFS